MFVALVTKRGLFFTDSLLFTFFLRDLRACVCLVAPLVCRCLVAVIAASEGQGQRGLVRMNRGKEGAFQSGIMQYFVTCLGSL